MSDATANYAEHVPYAPLPRRRDPVETLWSVRADTPRNFLVLPDGRADLILRFRISKDESCGDAVPLFVGPSSLPHSVPLAQGDGFVGIRLRPGRLSWFGAASSFADRRFHGEDAIVRVPILSELPSGGIGFEAMIAAMRRVAVDLPEPDTAPLAEACLDQIHLAGGRMAPGALANRLGIGARQLHRLFAAHVGLPPQLYASVIRFQRAVRLRRRGLSVSATAHEAGYADQPHMTRGFIRHGGFTPARVPDIALGWMPMR